MQVKMGTKIKELRKRDGRKQEDLANALGVTCQAVSRWEANGGYPDMEMVPAIANYFNVSIDELFGYSKDREEKLRTILSKAERAINEQSDLTECVEMLRVAAEEFPSEPQVLIKLGYVLNMHGWKKYGARSYTTDDSDYAYEDTEYNAGNTYWQEEVKVFEKVLTMNISPEERDAITMMLVTVYAKMGCTDKAKALALKQNSFFMSREMLLPKATQAEEKDKYQGEAIISLLTEFKNVIVSAVCTKVSLFTAPVGVKLFIDLAHMCEAVFSDDRCGVGHYHIGELYLHAAVYEARYGEGIEKALEYFKKGFVHIKIYGSIRSSGQYQYSAPLVSKVTVPCESFPSLSKTFWKGWVEVLPDELRDRINADLQFSECFVR